MNYIKAIFYPKADKKEEDAVDADLNNKDSDQAEGSEDTVSAEDKKKNT